MPDSDSFHDIFFIFHAADADFVHQLDELLADKNVDCQVVEAESGDKKEVRDAILRAYLVAIVLSPESAASQTCNELVQYAVTSSKRLVTLIVDEHIEVDVHPAVAENPYVFFREQDVLEEGAEQLFGLLALDSHIKLHTELLVYASHWQQSESPADLLLPLERVDQARQWLTDGVHRLPKPSQLQVEYIHASRRQKSKPPARTNLSVYQVLALAVLIAVVVVVGSLQNAVASRSATAETAVGLETDIAATQGAALLELATAETANSDVMLADMAANVADSITQIAQTDATAVPTEVPASADMDLIDSAEQALEAGAADLALALALAASESPDDPGRVYRLLNRAAALSPALVLDDAALLRFHPAEREFALIPRTSNRVMVYDMAARTLKYEWADHETDVVALAYSPDGKYLVTAAQDGEIAVRSGANELHRLRHEGGAAAIAMYPDGRRMVTAGGAPLLTVWDLASGEELASYAAEEEWRVDDLLVTADGSRIIAWSNDENAMRQWSAETLDALEDEAHYRGNDPDGRIGFSGGRALPAYPGDPHTGELVFWDLASAQPVSRLTDGFNWSILDGSGVSAATDSLLDIAFRDDLALLVVGNADLGSRAVLVDVNEGTVLDSYENGIATADFVDSQTVLSATEDGRLVLWSSANGKPLREIGAAPRPLREVMLHAKGDAALGLADDGTAYLWLIAPPPGLLQVLSDAEDGTALNRSGAAVLLVNQDGAALQNIDRGESILTLADGRLARMNENGSHFAVRDENSIRVYDAVSGAEERAWTIERDDIQDLTLAPAGDAVLIHTRSDRLWLLHSESDDARRLPMDDLGAALLTRFAADGRRLMTLHAQSLVVRETADAAARQGYRLGLTADAADMAFSIDGDRLYFFAQLEDNLAGLTVFSLTDDSMNHYAFVDVQYGELTPDGEHLLLASSDHSIRIIDTADGTAAARLAGHQAAIRKLHYQAAYNRLLSADDNGSLMVWDVEAGAIDQQYVHRQAALDFSFRHDSQRILTRDSGGVYRLWQIESLPELIGRIQANYRPRELTCAEREQHQLPPLCERQ